MACSETWKVIMRLKHGAILENKYCYAVVLPKSKHDLLEYLKVILDE